VNATDRLRAAGIGFVRRGEPDYEPTRRSLVWNARVPDRFPELIVRAGAADAVAAAIATARELGLAVAVRSGGHNWNGACLRDASMLIDLSPMRSISLDAEAMTARCGPAATNGELAALVEPNRLAFPIGHSPDVGLGGYLLGGGLGWNPRTWGAACANVRAVDAVLADGTAISADEDENTDVLWGVRGAGPGFPAVITSYTLALHPLPAAIAGSTYVLPIDSVREIARWLADEIGAGVDSSLELTCILRSGPPVGAEWSGPALVLAPTVFAERRADAERILARFDRCTEIATPMFADVAFPLSLSGSVGRAYLPPERRYAVDNLWCDGDPEPALAAVAERMQAAPSASTAAVVGLTPAPPTDGTAFTMRGDFHVSVYCVWSDAADDEANDAWLRDTMAAVAPTARGTFSAEADFSRADADPAAAFTPEAWQRLHALRAAIDPTGVFVSYLADDRSLVAVNRPPT
jgi:FAD/FMN-containing dehydrogenase